MKANELRIGNWFFNGKFCQQVNPTHLDYLLNENFYPHESMQPITLTAERLAIAGFVEGSVVNGDGDDVYFYSIQKPNKDFLYINYETLQPEDGGFPIVDYEIKYIHQFQNFYYTHTLEELPINFQ
jgi:hypothetical protein